MSSNLKNLLEYLMIIERKSNIEYISIINSIKKIMKVGAPYFVDITSEIKDPSKMIYKVYELQKSSDEMKTIGFDELWITIVNPKKDKDERYKIKTAEINPQNEMIIFPNIRQFSKLEESENKLLYIIDIFNQAIEHELTHQINKLRANNKIYRSSGGKEQFIPGSEAYINSTEEIQARLIPIINSIHMAVEDNGSNMGKILKKYIKNKDFKSFLKYVFGLFHDKLHLDSANEKTKKRYTLRLYEIFIELSDKI